MHILSIPENILLFISGFGIIQGFLLSSLVYFHPRSNRSVNIFLALYIVAISVVMAGPFVLNTFSWQITLVIQPLSLLIGPLLFLYVKSFKQQVRFRNILPHLFFFAAYIMASFAWSLYTNNAYRSSVTVPVHALLQPQAILLCAIPYLHLLLYYFITCRELKRYRASAVSPQASAGNMRWMKWLINGFLFIILSALVIYILMIKFPQHFTLLYLVTMAVATPYIYITTYKGITHSSLWLKHAETGQTKAAVQPAQPPSFKLKPHRQEPANPKLDEIVHKIKTVMEEEKLYQEPELTLQHIADKLQFPTYQVSQAINDGLKKSFYELVNGYRVDKAKLLLLNPKNRNYTILSVGFEAGFNSKTTFNTVFKKFTGQTPTQFRDQQQTMVA